MTAKRQKFVVRYDGSCSGIEPATYDEDISFAEAKKELIAYLKQTRDTYGDAVKAARKLHKPKT